MQISSRHLTQPKYEKKLLIIFVYKTIDIHQRIWNRGFSIFGTATHSGGGQN